MGTFEDYLIKVIEEEEERNMETKHTPGPWTVQNGAVYKLDGTPIRIASMDRNGPNKASPIECDANARLISKAWLISELENALKLAIPIIGKVVADNLMPDIVMPHYPTKVLERINDCLAKLEKE